MLKSEFKVSSCTAQPIGVTPKKLAAMRARGECPPLSGAGRWIRYERGAVLSWLANLPRYLARGVESKCESAP